jgi:hypothetical protein
MIPEQAAELKNTILWEEFCKEIDKKIKYETSLLEKCDPDELKSIQQKIAALREVKNIPQDVIDREE